MLKTTVGWAFPKIIDYSIAKPLTESGYKRNFKNSFKVIYGNKGSEIDQFAETLAIRMLNPFILCPIVVHFYHWDLYGISQYG